MYIEKPLVTLSNSSSNGPHLLDMLKPYQWEDSYWWLSLDVSSLYTSIPLDVGVRAIEHFMANDPHTNSRQAHFII